MLRIPIPDIPHKKRNSEEFLKTHTMIEI